MMKSTAWRNNECANEDGIAKTLIKLTGLVTGGMDGKKLNPTTYNKWGDNTALKSTVTCSLQINY